MLRDGAPIAIVRASDAAEACALVESALAMDDARAILARAGLSPDAVIGVSLGGAATGCGKLEARGPTAEEAQLWGEHAASAPRVVAIMTV